jgi:hypothetical protein|tara:strand:- start:355 stop:564 length:210 start_codon:yes stop_codon:yes gene_type:complete
MARLKHLIPLRQAGFTDEQADAMAEFTEEVMATKQDISDLEYRLSIKIIMSNFAVVAILGGIIGLVKFL